MNTQYQASKLINGMGFDRALAFAEKQAFNFDGIVRRTDDEHARTMSILWNEVAGLIIESKVAA